jgi:hypothetical protein
MGKIYIIEHLIHKNFFKSLNCNWKNFFGTLAGLNLLVVG